jgi:hypothetical protein
MGAIFQKRQQGSNGQLTFFESATTDLNKAWPCHSGLLNMAGPDRTRKLVAVKFKGVRLQTDWKDKQGKLHLEQNCGAINRDLFRYINNEAGKGNIDVDAMLDSYTRNYPALASVWKFAGPDNFNGFSGLLEKGRDDEKKWADHVIRMRANLFANMLATP